MFKRQTFRYLLITTATLVLIQGCTQLAPVQKQSLATSTVTHNSNTVPTPPTAISKTARNSQPDSNASITEPKTNDVKSTQSTPSQSAEDQKLKDISVPVLYYHSISSIEPKNELRMPPSEFEKQMAYLSQHGYHTVSLTQLDNFFHGKGTLPAKPIAITFDDGYKDNYTNALPILKKYGFTATVFVIVNEVGKNDKMSWEELNELIHAGWEIGSHTMNHLDLTKLNSSKLIQEVKQSKELLENHLGNTIKFFVYPSGRYNANVVKTIKDAGYIMAFTTVKGWDNRKTDPFLEHRVYCYKTMGMKEFENRIKNSKY